MRGGAPRILTLGHRQPPLSSPRMLESLAEQKSFQVGGRHVVTIQDIAFGGEGVARIDDFVVFVPFVALGESVEVELTEVNKKFARAKLLRIITPSPDRIQPLYQYFGDCGGCQYQHIAYETQLTMKHKQI